MDLNNLFQMILMLILGVVIAFGVLSLSIILVSRYKRKNFQKSRKKLADSRFLVPNLSLAPINNNFENYNIVKEHDTSPTNNRDTHRFETSKRIQVLNHTINSYQNSQEKAYYYKG